MQFGQFFSHDITGNNFDNFCACNSVHENLVSVSLARDDPKTPQLLLPCIPITRSIPIYERDGVPREQMNRHTSHIDTSMMHGSTDPDMKRLKNGHLLKTQLVNGREFPPLSIADQFDGMSTGESNINSLLPSYTGYRQDVDSSNSNKFAATAFRLHRMISAFFETRRIEKQVTEKLFDATADLASVNIVRGRDHGLRSYNEFRRMCQLALITNFREWNEGSNETVKSKVAELHKNPENIDLYLGGITEETLIGSMVGPTFACTISEQFKRLHDSDRFYFENKETFKTRQTRSIQDMSLASIICMTGDNYGRIPRNAFKTDKSENAVSCDDISKLDYELWRSIKV
uniref:Peroxidase n=1 Tax=Rhabditophanes sp. KR3021 TaxID=114890 RepID=A0AC35U520_9BILA